MCPRRDAMNVCRPCVLPESDGRCPVPANAPPPPNGDMSFDSGESDGPAARRLSGGANSRRQAVTTTVAMTEVGPVEASAAVGIRVTKARVTPTGG